MSYSKRVKIISRRGKMYKYFKFIKFKIVNYFKYVKMILEVGKVYELF